MATRKPTIVHGLLTAGLYLHAAGLFWLWCEGVAWELHSPEPEHMGVYNWSNFIILVFFIATCSDYFSWRRESLGNLLGFFVLFYVLALSACLYMAISLEFWEFITARLCVVVALGACTYLAAILWGYKHRDEFE